MLIGQDKSKTINIAIILYEISALLYNTNSFQILGYFFIILATGLLTLHWVKVSDFRLNTTIRTIIPLIIIGIIYLFGLLRNISFQSLSNLFSLWITFILLLIFPNINANTIDERLQRKIMLVQIIIIGVPKLLNQGINPIDGGYMSIFTTTTFLGVFSCLSAEICYLFYQFSKKKVWIIYGIIWLYYIWEARTRTAMAGVLIILVFSTIAYITHNNDRVLIALKWITYIIIILIVIIYPQLNNFSWYGNIEAFVYEYTNKVLLSGRNEIWSEALDIIKQSPIWGYGLDYSNYFSWPVHNSYLNILLQTGVIGLISVIALINTFLNLRIKNGKNISYLIAIITMSNLIICSFEVMLLQGQIILQIIVWILIGLNINENGIYKKDQD